MNPPERPRWGVHAALLGLVVLAGVVAIACIEPASSKHEGALGILVGFAEGMQVLGLILGVLGSVAFHLLVSTVLLFLLRMRRHALLWAHAGSALLLLLYVGGSYLSYTAREEQRLLEEKARLEVEAAAKRERDAAEERTCLFPSLTIIRRLPDWPEQPGKRNHCDVSLTHRADLCSAAQPSAFRLRGHGNGWQLALTTGSFEGDLGVVKSAPIAAGSFESVATEDDIEHGGFTLEVRFRGRTEWVPYPVHSVDVRSVPSW